MVADSEHEGLRAKIQPFVYMPYMTQDGLGSLTFYVRSTGDDKRAMQEIRTVVQKADAGLPLYDFRTVDELVTTVSSRSAD